MSVTEILEKVVAKVEAGDFKGAERILLLETTSLDKEEEHQLLHKIIETCKKENDPDHTASLASLTHYFSGVRAERHRRNNTGKA